MNRGGLDWLAYPWGDGRERIVAIGDSGATPLLLLAPLFEEANRTRHFMIEIMRGLAARGFRCFLPDLPGTLESITPIDGVAWTDWHAAIARSADAIGSPFHIASLRGGALLDGGVMAQSRWRLAPVTGEALLRELIRTRMAADREDGLPELAASIEAKALSDGLEVAGYRLGAPLLAGLKAANVASGGAIRTIRLESDPHEADIKVSGTPLWRNSEPSHYPALSQYLVSDIADWISECVNG